MMCSIGGAFIYKYPQPDAVTLCADLVAQFRRGSDRGRDHWGYTIMNAEGRVTTRKGVGSSLNIEGVDFGKIFQGGTIFSSGTPVTHFMYHCRAEPLTEAPKEPPMDPHRASIMYQAWGQPVQVNPWLVAHNGIISNDADIVRKVFQREPALAETWNSWLTHTGHALDTHALALGFKEAGEKGLPYFLQNDVVGSFALSALNSSFPMELWLACNYKPIYIWCPVDGILFYSSDLMHFGLDGQSFTERSLLNRQPVKVPPYSLLHFKATHGELQITRHSLKQKPQQKRALIVCSGGMDSAVTASWAIHEGWDIDLLHFRYECKAQVREERAVTDLANWLGCEVIWMPTGLFKGLGGSTLTDASREIVQDEDGRSSAEFATEWVPARNLVMLAIATAVAEARGYDTIMYGGNLEESGCHPDNEPEFVRGFNMALHNATNLNVHVQLIAPLMNMMKVEIIKLGQKLGVPFDLTWTCYTPGPDPCGKCGACFNRVRAFKALGLKDPLNEFREGIPCCIECDIAMRLLGVKQGAAKIGSDRQFKVWKCLTCNTQRVTDEQGRILANDQVDGVF